MNTAANVLRAAAPVAITPFKLTGKAGLVCVDPVNGFCTVGCGPLAPAVPNAQVDRMIDEMDRLAKRLIKDGAPVHVFLDTHVPGRAEPPYPPHCEVGTGQEEIVDKLAWMLGNPSVEILKKDVINGVVGAIGPDGSNSLFSWIRKHEIETLIAAFSEANHPRECMYGSLAASNANADAQTLECAA
jgi:nicotinamidase-related amidase